MLARDPALCLIVSYLPNPVHESVEEQAAEGSTAEVEMEEARKQAEKRKAEDDCYKLALVVKC